MEGNSQPTGHMREPSIHAQSNTIKREEPSQREFSLVRPRRTTIQIACWSRVFAVSCPKGSDLRPGVFRVCEISCWVVLATNICPSSFGSVPLLVHFSWKNPVMWMCSISCVVLEESNHWSLFQRKLMQAVTHHSHDSYTGTRVGS